MEQSIHQQFTSSIRGETPAQHHQHTTNHPASQATSQPATQCHICNQPHSELHILPCAHSYCERCLTIWVGVYIDTYRSGQQEFPCRICWTLFHVPPLGGLAAFKYNAEIQALSLDLGQMSMDIGNAGGGESQNAMMTSQTDIMTSQSYAIRSPIDTMTSQSNVITSPTETMTSQSNVIIQPSDSMNEDVMNSNTITNTDQDSNTNIDLNMDPYLTDSRGDQSDSRSMNMGNNANMMQTNPSNAICQNGNFKEAIETSVQTSTGSGFIEIGYGEMIPISGTDQQIYRNRLCFPSCHTYMHHLG